MTEYPELGLAGMYRIIKKSGGERVSEEAADQLRRILETIATKISDQAVEERQSREKIYNWQQKIC
jgi:histone H3/H4